MYPICCVFFDWGGTLSKPGHSKDTFVYHQCLKKRLKTLRADALGTLKGLLNKGIKLGIITNTHISPDDFKGALVETGMMNLFEPELILASNEPDLCFKPCPEIFEKALKRSGCAPERTLFVGNNYYTDIVGAHNVGMQTALIGPSQRYQFATYKIQKLSNLLNITDQAACGPVQ